MDIKDIIRLWSCGLDSVGLEQCVGVTCSAYNFLTRLVTAPFLAAQGNGDNFCLLLFQFSDCLSFRHFQRLSSVAARLPIVCCLAWCTDISEKFRYVRCHGADVNAKFICNRTMCRCAISNFVKYGRKGERYGKEFFAASINKVWFSPRRISERAFRWFVSSTDCYRNRTKDTEKFYERLLRKGWLSLNLFSRNSVARQLFVNKSDNGFRENPTQGLVVGTRSTRWQTDARGHHMRRSFSEKNA
jgi:hypothetical protein